MATGNFAYTNRCVYVSDDDYECGNMPKLGSWLTPPRHSFNSYKLEDYNEDLQFYQIIYTSGYYEGGCIDYETTERSLDEYIGNCHYINTCKDFFHEVKQYFDIQNSKLQRICKRLKDFENFESWLNHAYNAVESYLVEQEERICNERIDTIKEDFGYIELQTSAHFSNGEVCYNQI